MCRLITDHDRDHTTLRLIMSTSEEDQQRDRATAFLSRWLEESNRCTDGSRGVSGDNKGDTPCVGGDRDCSGSGASSSPERRCTPSEDQALQETYARCESWLRRNDDDFCDDGGGSGIPSEVIEAYHAQPKQRAQQSTHGDERLNSSRRNDNNSCVRIRGNSLGPPRSSVSFVQPTAEQPPQAQASRERVGETPPRRRSMMDDLPKNMKAVQLTSATSSLPFASAEFVRCLPWTDASSGEAGQYTGPIDDQGRPHGYGSLFHADGSVANAVWEHGAPVPWWPPEDVASRRPRATRPPPRAAARPPSPSPNWTFVPRLSLGDAGDSRCMLAAAPTRAGIDALRTHDFAFVRRTCGRWTYAIVAARVERFLLFVVDSVGNTKAMEENLWATSIRLVNPKEACSPASVRRRAASNKKAREQLKKNIRKSSERHQQEEQKSP